MNSNVCVCVCVCVCVKSHQSSPTLCDFMDCKPAGSSVHGILQARILELVAMPSTRGSFQPRDGTPVFYISCIGRQVLYHYCHLKILNSNAGVFKVSNISNHEKEKIKRMEKQQSERHVGHCYMILCILNWSSWRTAPGMYVCDKMRRY